MALQIENKKLTTSTTLLKEFMRKDPHSYAEEYLKYISHWESLVPLIKANKVNLEVEDVTDTISVVFSVCRQEHKGIPERLFQYAVELIGTQNATESPELSIEISPKILRALLQGIMLLRSRSLLPSSETLPFFFTLLSIKDKEARKMLLWHITSDIVKMNAKSKAISDNKKLQCLLYKIMQSDSAHRSRHSLSLLIELYRRRVWNTELPVFFISEGVFLKNNTFCIKIALYFLLSHPLSFRDVEEDPDEGKEDPGKRISLLKKSFQYRKKNRGREQKLKRTVSEISKDYGDDEENLTKQEYKKIEPQFDPLLLLRDPQDFAERLLKLLQRTTELFDVRLLMMKVLSKLIALHHLVLLPFYSFLQRYMQPYQREITAILALCTETFHELIPPEELTPLVKSIANHFIHDRSSPDSITIALATIREMCKKQPLIMNKEFLSDLAEYAKYREDRGVSMAAKSLIRLFREIHPEMLPSKFRGRQPNLNSTIMPFATKATSDTIPGLNKLSTINSKDSEQSEASDDESDTDSTSDDNLEVSVDLNSEGELEEDQESTEESEDAAEVNNGDDEEIDGDTSGAAETTEEENDIPMAEPEANRTIIPLYDHIFTDAEFQALKRINQAAQKGSKSSHREAPIFVDSSIIEEFSTTKRADLKEQKLEQIRQKRSAHSVGSKKKKRHGSSSHAEKLKAKPFQMAKRSTRVVKRSRQSVSTKNSQQKKNAKKNIKFRIRRGYKV